MIYDGDCHFCRRWIERWRRTTAVRVDYCEYQQLNHRWPEIPHAAFEEAVQLIELDRTVLSGADAVFCVLEFAPGTFRLARMLRRIPGFMPIARAALAPPEIVLGGGHEVWPATLLFERGAAVPVDELAACFSELPCDPWDQPPRRAVLVPIAQQGQERPAGFLVAGLNPYRPFDAAYAGFLDLLARQIAAGLASARAYEAERKRAEALAEIDQAKTAFFSNVSHEFRTPLTLLLSPLEEIVNKPGGEVLEDNRQLATLAHRNGLRLLKLVNTLLDFSRIEAGRTRARFEPVDLNEAVRRVCAICRSTVQERGLRLEASLDDAAGLVAADPARLRRCFGTS